ncbi:MAG: cadherin-like beta sandwich domain-containing protein [Lutisporaceae bacterium]
MSTNLALNKTTTASSYVKPFQPSRAVDANNQPEFRWICNTLPGWLKVDLGGEYYINRWVVVHMGAAGWDNRYNTSNYSFQGSLDNANWFTLDTVAGNTLATTDRTIAITKVRYVRVSVTGGIAINPKLASIVELQVYQAPASPYLSGLTISSGTLIPDFNMNIIEYTVTVPNNVTSITVTPTAAQDPKPTVTVNGTIVVCGQASGSINLNEGSNTITVVSTAADGLSQVTYTINATRASSPYLTRVDVIYMGRELTTVPVNIVSNQTEYNVDLPSNITKITMTSYSQDTNALILVNGNQNLTNGQVSAEITVAQGTRVPINVTSSIGTDSEAYGITIA